jgi:hypothetical protein
VYLALASGRPLPYYLKQKNPRGSVSTTSSEVNQASVSLLPQELVCFLSEVADRLGENIPVSQDYLFT